MGTIPDPDYDEGDACSACFGIGKTFGDNPTPTRIKATFSDITNCPYVTANPNQSFILTQNTPCQFINWNGPELVTFDFCMLEGGNYYAWAWLKIFPYTPHFFSGFGLICETVLANGNVIGQCAAHQVSGYGGQAEISWGPEI